MARIVVVNKGHFDFAFNKIKFLGFSISASVRPHKKGVKKIEAEGAKEKQLLPKLGFDIGL